MKKRIAVASSLLIYCGLTMAVDDNTTEDLKKKSVVFLDEEVKELRPKEELDIRLLSSWDRLELIAKEGERIAEERIQKQKQKEYEEWVASVKAKQEEKRKERLAEEKRQRELQAQREKERQQQLAKQKQVEEQQIKLLKENKIDVIVLARYMQILTENFVAEFPNQIINIHHSFLPAFVGARPYERAFERGVKLIGATSHYVTNDLDEGPIIEQDIKRVDHRDTVERLKKIGRTIERSVLARALKWHLDDRVIVHKNKTIRF